VTDTPKADPPQGLMQITQSTFERYGPKGADIHDRAANIAAAIRYLRERYGT
jgi:SLT domain-containing protein